MRRDGNISTGQATLVAGMPRKHFAGVVRATIRSMVQMAAQASGTAIKAASATTANATAASFHRYFQNRGYNNTSIDGRRNQKFMEEMEETDFLEIGGRIDWRRVGMERIDWRRVARGKKILHETGQ
jgi:hypothetical protein